MRRLSMSIALAVGCTQAAQPASTAPSPSSATPRVVVSEAPAPIPRAPKPAPAVRKDTGPFETELADERNVYWIAPHAPGKQRLMAMLHGICNPPAYTCGLWAEDAKQLGFLVCPTGNSRCGKASYDAPTWTEPDSAIDADLETSIAAVDAIVPGELAREDGVLLGFSKGAYASVKIAAAHPGRWPYLVLVEADAKVTADQLRKSGVRAVAFVAGEIGSQLAGEKKTAQSLAAQGYPAKLWVMPKAGHYYSNDVGTILHEAVEWVTSHK